MRSEAMSILTTSIVITTKTTVIITYVNMVLKVGHSPADIRIMSSIMYMKS